LFSGGYREGALNCMKKLVRKYGKEKKKDEEEEEEKEER